jgi:hypothetical protein
MNRGTGAGGAGTNATGLPFEEKTSLTKYLKCEPMIRFGRGKNDTHIPISITDTLLLKRLTKNGLNKYMERYHADSVCSDCKKKYQPDEAFIDSDRNIIWILEKKFQSVSGSVDEKLETGFIKKLHYEEEQFTGFTIHYAYVLNNWFKQPCYDRILKLYRIIKERYGIHIPIFWGEDESYAKDLTEWIQSTRGT